MPRCRCRAAHLERNVDAVSAGLLKDNGAHFFIGNISDIDTAIGAEFSGPLESVLFRIGDENFPGSRFLRQGDQVEAQHPGSLDQHRLFLQ